MKTETADKQIDQTSLSQQVDQFKIPDEVSNKPVTIALKRLIDEISNAPEN